MLILQFSVALRQFRIAAGVLGLRSKLIEVVEGGCAFLALDMAGKFAVDFALVIREGSHELPLLGRL